MSAPELQVNVLLYLTYLSTSTHCGYFPFHYHIYMCTDYRCRYILALFTISPTCPQAIAADCFTISPTCPQTIAADCFTISATCPQTIAAVSPSHRPVHRLSLVIALPSHLPVPQTTAAHCFTISGTNQCKTNRCDCFTTSPTCPQAIAADCFTTSPTCPQTIAADCFTTSPTCPQAIAAD